MNSLGEMPPGNSTCISTTCTLPGRFATSIPIAWSPTGTSFFRPKIDRSATLQATTKLPVLSPQYFSATNPIAYGSDQVWHERWPGAKDSADQVTQLEVDRFYTAEILNQVTADRLNRIDLGKSTIPSIPWVARYCKIADNEKTSAPMMTRESYRAALGQLWEQGIATMQVFNAMHQGYEELAVTELKDAVLAYDQSLASSIPDTNK